MEGGHKIGHSPIPLHAPSCPPTAPNTYDAENRITQVDGGATASHLYNAEGRRVMRTTGSNNWSVYLYDDSGKVVAETNPNVWATGYAYLGGRLVAQHDRSTTHFFHQDHLGSTRLLTGMG